MSEWVSEIQVYWDADASKNALTYQDCACVSGKQKDEFVENLQSHRKFQSRLLSEAEHCPLCPAGGLQLSWAAPARCTPGILQNHLLLLGCSQRLHSEPGQDNLLTNLATDSIRTLYFGIFMIMLGDRLIFTKSLCLFLLIKSISGGKFMSKFWPEGLYLIRTTGF